MRRQARCGSRGANRAEANAPRRVHSLVGETVEHLAGRGLLFSDVLSDASRAELENWLVANRTGDARVRAGLPSGWRVGDKTGTGANAAVNDVAVFWPPERSPVVIAIFMSWSDEEITTLSAVHAYIAALAAELLIE